MCGITGILKFDGKPINAELLVRMTRTLAHRGPDEEGYFVNTNRLEGREAGKLGSTDVRIHTLGKDYRNGQQMGGNVGLGHRRLSIIDLATGQQPLRNEDGTIWIAFNGEIYNFQELKNELEGKGHIFRTNSDTETIVHAYEEWGENSVKRLRGMFAFAIWDQRRERMFLARDRIGKKPLYYFIDNDRFIFTSEIKALLEVPDINRDLDITALSDYLSLMYVPAPKTIFKHIQKLPAAHYAIVKKNDLEIRSYWDLSFYPNHDLSENQMIDDLLGILHEATRIRMISEVPLGAFLSGGVDSSAVVAMMANANQDPVITNSISFREDLYNEAPYARRIAEIFKTDHNEFQVTPEAIPIIEKLSWHYDEPFADSSAVPTYYVSKIARQNVTVSLSGDGGDENFAGYKRYFFDNRETYFRNLLPVFLQRSFYGLLSSLYPKTDFLSNIFRGKAFISNVARDPVDAYLFTVSVIHDDYKKDFLNPEVFQSLGSYRTLDFFKKIYAQAPAEDHLSKIQYLDVKTYLCEDILTKVDRASMAVSLEVRCPLLDHVFMEYVAQIPKKRKLVGKNGKYIFKKALEKFIPADLLYRNKMGFAIPILEWFKSDIKEYSRSLIVEGSATKNYLNRINIKRIWEEHQNGIKDWSFPLWSIMMLNLWHERFVERKVVK